MKSAYLNISKRGDNMTDLMPAGVISDLIRTVLTTLIDRPAFLILGVVYEVFF